MALEFSGNKSATVSRIFTAHALSKNNGVNIMATSYTPERQAGVLRVTIAVTTTSKLYLTLTDGATAYTDISLNNDTLLTAGALYLFEFPVSATKEGYDGETPGTALLYNFQLGTTSVIRTMIVDYVTGPVV